MSWGIGTETALDLDQGRPSRFLRGGVFHETLNQPEKMARRTGSAGVRQSKTRREIKNHQAFQGGVSPKAQLLGVRGS